MTTVHHVTVEELRAERKRLLDLVHMPWEQFEELATAYALSSEERNIYEGIRTIDFLLAGDAA